MCAELYFCAGKIEFVERLERGQHEGYNWGWGVGDDMDNLMAEYGFAEE
ncbi:MAG TPA: hypothetical protein VGA63_11750 [Geopsychrobacteraceae bacterium]